MSQVTTLLTPYSHQAATNGLERLRPPHQPPTDQKDMQWQLQDSVEAHPGS